MIGGNWGQFVHSSFLQNASSLDMPIVVLFQRERNDVCEDFIGGMYI